MDYLPKLNSVYNGDCLEELKKFPDNSIDCIITDPPYGIKYQSSWRIDTERFDMIDNDDKILTGWINECYRILKNNTAFYMFSRMDVYEEWKKQITKTKFNIKNILIWDRIIHGMGDLNGSYAPCYDIIFFVVKGKHILNKRHQDILRIQRVNAERLLHPTQKPSKLIEILVNNSTQRHDIILDPFMGSGSTCVACKQTNRKYIGIEINPDYVKIAKKRLNNVPIRLDMLKPNHKGSE